MMLDKNGAELVVGDKVRDNQGREGDMVNVSGTTAVRFTHEGEIRYTFLHKLVSSQIEKVS